MDSHNGLDRPEERGRWRRLARLARILGRPELDRRRDDVTRARVDAVPLGTADDVLQRRRELARRWKPRP